MCELFDNMVPKILTSAFTMASTAEGKEDELVIETGNWFLDSILRPGSSTSTGTLSFLHKIFYVLFACIFFLM